MRHRLGLDLGGTKIEAAVLGPAGEIAWRHRVATPGEYDGIVAALAGLVRAAEAGCGAAVSVGLGVPGVVDPATGLVLNAATRAVAGRALGADLASATGRAVRVENDANCFALSEASDGAGRGVHCVFGAIVGTGCGGGIVVGGRVLRGRHRIAGEWGHMPLPWPLADEVPPPACWCGLAGCLELYVSGPGLARSCGAADVPELMARAAVGEAAAQAALGRHADRLARGLALVCSMLDPDVIVLGGGVSNLAHLYQRVPALLPRYLRHSAVSTPVLRPMHGDSSGVRGAAWLWPVQPPTRPFSPDS